MQTHELQEIIDLNGEDVVWKLQARSGYQINAIVTLRIVEFLSLATATDVVNLYIRNRLH